MLTRIIQATGLAFILSAAFAAAAQAYTLTADEARFIAVSETDGNYKFRGVVNWGAWADDQATGWNETQFTRQATDVVVIEGTRQWFGCNHGPCGQPDANYWVEIYEFYGPGAGQHQYAIRINSWDQYDPNGDAYYPLSSAWSSFTRSGA